MLAIFSFLLAAAPFPSEMTKQEERAAGLHKLTTDERNFLQNWVDNHYVAQTKTQAKQKNPSIEENLQSGQYLRLTDGTMWEVYPQDQSLAQSWLLPSEIIVTQTKDKKYPYTLTNSATNSSIRARKISKIPASKKKQAAPVTTPAE